MLTIEERMRERWLNLWSEFNHRGDPEALFNDLAARYSEPHRAYHTLEHIEHCLKEFDDLYQKSSKVPQPRWPYALEMALWYHDTIYDTHAKDSEEQSALLVEKTFRDGHVLYPHVHTVMRYVRVTAHSQEPKDTDEQIVLDIDLSILGQAPDVFDKYEQDVRFEYSWVPEDAFRAGRKKILQTFLDRPRIYHLNYFHDRLEAQARDNLARSIAALA